MKQSLQRFISRVTIRTCSLMLLFMILFLPFTDSAPAATDHSSLITSYEGSKTCRTCHPGAVNEVLESIHYTLMGQVQDVYNMFTNRPIEGIHGKGNRY